MLCQSFTLYHFVALISLSIVHLQSYHNDNLINIKIDLPSSSQSYVKCYLWTVSQHVSSVYILFLAKAQIKLIRHANRFFNINLLLIINARRHYSNMQQGIKLITSIFFLSCLLDQSKHFLVSDFYLH